MNSTGRIDPEAKKAAEAIDLYEDEPSCLKMAELITAAYRERTELLRELYELALAAPKEGWDKWRNATERAEKLLGDQ